MDERKARRQRYFDDLASEWDAMCPSDELERIGGLVGSFGLAPGHHVLDIGCGTGRLVHFLLDCVAGLGSVVGIDFSLRMLQWGRRKIMGPRALFLPADAEHLPFAEGRFHAVICFAAFPHLDAKERAVAEFCRVTRPGGRLVILHLSGRDEMNRFHQQLPDAVSSDLLPPIAEMRRLVKGGGYEDVSVENRPDLFLLRARRPA